MPIGAEVTAALKAIYGAIINQMAVESVALAVGNDFVSTDAVNAIAHAHASAATRYMFDLEVAEALGNLKETQSDPGQEFDSLKDQYNNKVGIKIAEWALENDLGPQALDRLVIDAALNGDLIVSESDDRLGTEPTWEMPHDWQPALWGTEEDPLKPKEYGHSPNPLGDLAEWANERLERAMEGIDALANAIDRAIRDAGNAIRDGGEDLKNDLRNFIRDMLSDPIILDLDGDGVELTALAQSTTMFDIDGDGVAERTGWASPQDGFLVHDANSNGQVDGVGELFGSANVDGYDELQTYDSNSDGRIDSSDALFGELRIWRDLNSDGFSTSNELQTLTEAGITRLNLSYSQVDQNAAGNIIARTGTYVRADGTTRSMASVLFALEEPGSPYVIPEGADLGNIPALPNLPSYADAPDLWTAMYFDPVLKEMVEDLVFGNHDFETFQDFAEGGFTDIVYRWLGIDTSQPEDPQNPYYVEVFEKLVGLPIVMTNDHQRDTLADRWPLLLQEIGMEFLFQAARGEELDLLNNAARALQNLDLESATALSEALQLADAALADLESANPAYEFLELFTGLDLDPTTGEITGDFDAFVARFLEDQPSFQLNALHFIAKGSPDGRIAFGEVEESPHPWVQWYEDQGQLLYSIAEAMGLGSDYVLNATGWKWMAGAFTSHQGTSSADLLNFTVTYYQPDPAYVGAPPPPPVATYDQMLFGYGGDDELRGNNGADRLIGGTGNDLLRGGSDSDMYIYNVGDGLDRITDDSGLDDAIYFSSEFDAANLVVTRISGTNDLQLHFGNPAEGIILTNQWISSATAVEHVHFVGEAGLNAGDIASHYLASLATAGADNITGSWANEQLIGLDGNDTLTGADGDDIIDGGTGDDTLSGGNHNDVLKGGAGNDILNGNNNNDTLIGGTGNDILTGWSGDDSYVFNLGDGQDIVRDFWSTGWGGTDTIVFGADILPGDVVVTQVNGGTDLLLSIAGTTDSILLDNSIVDSDYRIEQVQFANGTILSHADLMALATAPTAGNDTLYGSYDGEAIEGAGGNDTIHAREGNDTLIGGTGNDILSGWTGNDSYVFNLGDGQDIVQDFWSTGSGGSDAVIFGAGILPGDVVVTQVNGGTDLLLSIAGTTDSILLDNTMDDVDYRIEQVQFANGTVLSHADLVTLSTTPTAGNDTFYGSYDGETLQGGAGNDILSARGGNDTLIGGTGNDTLTGWTGNDSYVFNLGDGQDIVQDFWSTGSGGADTILFGAGILPSDLVVTQVNGGTDLLLSIVGTSDSILLDNTINDSDYRIEQVQFANGTILSHADLVTLSTAPTAGNDTFYGSYDGETLQGGAGNDVLIARDGNDTLDGGDGNDTLAGDSGTDTATYASATAGVTVSLAVTTAQNTIGAGTDTLSGIENLTGSAFSDTLTGSSAANTINGGAGNDIVNGGGGNDTLVGGADSDSFLFNTALNGTSNVDQISDFVAGVDQIALSQSIFTAAGAIGALIASAFQAGTAANDAQDRIVYDPASGKIYYDADGNGVGAQVLFAQVTAGLSLTHLDFAVI